MNISVIWADWIVVIFSTVLLLKYWKRITTNTRIIVYLLFFVLYVLPVYFDCLIAPPYYRDWLGQGFNQSASDPLTRTIYDIAIIFCQLCILFWRNKSTKIEQKQVLSAISFSGNGSIMLVIAGMIAPVLLVMLLCQQKFILYTPQWREVFDTSIVARYTYYEKLSYIGVACSLLCFTIKSKKNPLLYKIIALLFLYINICIEGKRSIIIFTLLVWLIIKIPGLVDSRATPKERKKELANLVFLAVFAVISVVVLTLVVKTGSRGYDKNDLWELYTATRIDFFRDDRVRLAIFELTNSGRFKMMDYPLQTFLTNPLSLFPIDYFLTRNGISFDTYSRLISSELVGRELKGVMTPCLFAEIISNFGLLGIIIMPMVCIWFSDISKKYVFPQNIMILTSFILLQMFDFTYISYFVEFTFLCCLMQRVSFRKGKLIIKRKKR